MVFFGVKALWVSSRIWRRLLWLETLLRLLGCFKKVMVQVQSVGQQRRGDGYPCDERPRYDDNWKDSMAARVVLGLIKVISASLFASRSLRNCRTPEENRIASKGRKLLSQREQD